MAIYLPFLYNKYIQIRVGEAHITTTMNKKQFIKGLILWLIVWSLAMVFFPLKRSKAEAPTMELKDMPIQTIITHYAKEYDVSVPVALAVARCESQFGKLPDGDGGKAKGLWQYWDDTWHRHYKEFYKETGIELIKGNQKDDTQLAMWAFSKGKATEWTTYVSLMNGGTYSFYSKQLKKHFTVKCSI